MLADEGVLLLPDLHDLRERLVGLRFPDGVTAVREHEAWLGHEAMLAPDVDGDHLHPLWPLIVGMRGMGTSVSELCELVGKRPDDAIMFGELEITQVAPLVVETLYTVRGEIRDVVRRTGRRAGVFDVVTFEHELRPPSGAVAATVTNSFVFVRRT